MPVCGCFHKYDLDRHGLLDHELVISVDGQVNLGQLLQKVLQKAGLARVTSANQKLKGLVLVHALLLSHVRDELRLRAFLDLLRSRVMIDLAPSVEECYALAPYTVFDEQQRSRTRLGELLYQAKYARDKSAARKLCTELNVFIDGHPTLSRCSCITGAPKSDASTPDLPAYWAREVADSRSRSIVPVTKVRPTPPQKQEVSDEQSEQEASARVADSMQATVVPSAASVLIIDDTVRSGGTMKEMARALLAAGAKEVFGLSVAKDARMMHGGIDLSKGRWP